MRAGLEGDMKEEKEEEELLSRQAAREAG